MAGSCQDCYIILNVVQKIQPALLETSGEYLEEKMKVQALPNGLMYISRRFKREDRWLGQLAAEFQLYSPDRPRIGDLIAFHDIARCPGDESMWQFLQQCVSRCLKSHLKCQVGQKMGWVPDRLLLVTREPTGLQKVRLIDTQGQTDSGRYIALSYCWGTSPTLLANKDTVATLRKGISTNELPATMGDCATVAINLGVNMVWIDALCIMQDDREDWARHSQQMGQIYANALFVVAACSSPDSSTPFLGPQAPNERLDSTCFSLDYASKALAHVRARNVEKIRLSFLRGPLEHRGWAWQERKLSRRNINFMSNQAIWICEEVTYHEHGMILNDDRNPQSKAATSTVADENMSFDDWHWYMNEFSPRDLTYATDRLPAVSGMAASFYPKYKCDYYAGLWANDFPFCLGWFADGQVDSDHVVDWPRALHNGVPSWSWASTGGKISWPHLMTNYTNKENNTIATSRIDAHAQLLEAKCDPAAGNVFGEVLPGSYLKVRGRVVEALMKCDGHGHGLIRRDGFEPQLVVPDCMLASRCDRSSGDTAKANVPFSTINRADEKYPDHRDDERIEGRVLCMLLYIVYDDEQDENQVFVLVLAKTDSDDNVYERIAAGARHWGPVYKSRQRWKQWEGWTGLEEWENYEEWFSDAKTLDICMI